MELANVDSKLNLYSKGLNHKESLSRLSDAIEKFREHRKIEKLMQKKEEEPPHL